MHDLPSRADGVLGLWLSGDPECVVEALRDVRRSCSHAHLPVFVDCELPGDLQFLSDGLAHSTAEALQHVLEWRPRVGVLHGSVAGPVLALIRYLYLRPLVALAPQRDWKMPQAYRYPLLEAFADGEAPASLLRTLQNRGWLEQMHLVDRLRHCEDCQSVHLNYVDVCPGCHSLNIEESAFIHCFTCSHVAQQERFIRQDGLCCPNCSARLRHIGTDYNRPLEQMHCCDCAASFEEPQVVARCLSCSREQTLEKLPILRVAAYALSESGRQAARDGGETASPLPLAARTQELLPEAFIGITDWLMSLSRRHGQAGFSLLGLYLEVPPELSRLMGPEGLRGLLDAFAARLRELMRDTDILSRINERLFWIALPQTSQAGARTLLEKILDFAEATRQEDGSRLEVRGVIHAAEDIPAEATAGQLLHMLGSRLQRGLPC